MEAVGFFFCLYTSCMSAITTTSPEETKALAARIVANLAKGDAKRGTSTILALQGNLGAGKTVFTKGAAEALGVTEHVTSPTFVIQKTYELTNQPWKQLVHIDAYRLESEV
jgi:tRNA threonylcarbamoyladenosine biosynthesis protein TsaE